LPKPSRTFSSAALNTRRVEEAVIAALCREVCRDAKRKSPACQFIQTETTVDSRS
jgi:hypothetical protein